MKNNLILKKNQKKELIKDSNLNYIPREPILLDKHTVALIHLFTRHDYLEDVWMIDTNYYTKRLHPYKDAAKQFVEQLDEHYCAAFVEELIIELATRYKDMRKNASTDNQDFKDLIERIKTI